MLGYIAVLAGIAYELQRGRARGVTEDEKVPEPVASDTLPVVPAPKPKLEPEGGPKPTPPQVPEPDTDGGADNE